MLIPLAVLAVGSIAAGFFGANILHMVSVDGNFFEGAIFVAAEKINLLEEIHHAPFLVKISPLVVGMIAIALAYVFYLKKTDLPEKLANAAKPFYQLSLNKWYFDEIYEFILVKPTKKIGDFLWRIIDIKFVDGVPNGAAIFCKFMSGKISKLQSGYIFNYALWMILGVIAIGFFLISSFKKLMLF
jgi:NADH-quinone oxidoreductase subunit L